MRNILKALLLISCMFFTVSINNAFAISDRGARTSINEAAVVAQIKAKLAADPITRNSQISVEYNNGVAILTGEVNSATEANTAVQIAESNRNVRDVDTNRLTVAGSNQVMKDSYITAKVKGKLIKEKIISDAGMSVIPIKVETQNGVVYLSGEAKSKSEINRAIRLARSVNDVQQVQSNLKVKTS